MAKRVAHVVAVPVKVSKALMGGFTAGIAIISDLVHILLDKIRKGLIIYISMIITFKSLLSSGEKRGMPRVKF